MKEINHDRMTEIMKGIDHCIEQVDDILKWPELSREDRMFFLSCKVNHEFCAQLIREVILGEYKDDTELTMKMRTCLALYNENLKGMDKRFGSMLNRNVDVDDKED